jgi:hypothetical protein
MEGQLSGEKSGTVLEYPMVGRLGNGQLEIDETRSGLGKLRGFFRIPRLSSRSGYVKRQG